jgi:dihydrolipoamide dehydrogenase
MTSKYDIVILGAGPGGYVAALKAAQSGKNVALIEKDNVGGMCLNWGCIPSKALMASAKVYDNIVKSKEYGIDGIDSSTVTLNWTVMVERAFKVVEKLTGGVKTLLAKNGVKVYHGYGEVVGNRSIRIDEEIIEFDNLIIATGSNYPLPFEDADEKKVLTPKNIYSLDKLPESIAIAGGGIIGVEFAFLFSMLGVKVSLFENKNHLVNFMDDEVIGFVERQLKKKKVKLSLESNVTGYEDGEVVYNVKGETKKEKADFLLSAATRKASLGGLDYLLKHGLELKNGYIRTDLRTRTSLPNIYAVGDVNGQWMLAHVSSVEGTTAVETINGGGHDLIYDMMPTCIYANPEISAVGLTEKGALKRGFLVDVGKFPLAANGKALAEGQSDGFVKVVSDKKYGEILGVHIVAENATDMISESALAMQLEGTLYDVAAVVHPHPTLSESVLEATLKGLGTPLHTM